jgi:hypothetical protein
VKPCNVVVGYKTFRGPCCLHLQGEVAGMGEHWIDIGRDGEVRQVPLVKRKRFHRRESLKTRIQPPIAGTFGYISARKNK